MPPGGDMEFIAIDAAGPAVVRPAGLAADHYTASVVWGLINVAMQARHLNFGNTR